MIRNAKKQENTVRRSSPRDDPVIGISKQGPKNTHTYTKEFKGKYTHFRREDETKNEPGHNARTEWHNMWKNFIGWA